MMLDKVEDEKLKREYIRRFFFQPGDRLSDAKASAEHFRALFANQDRDKEHFGVVYLNQQNQIITSVVLFSGTLNSAAVYPRELVKDVIRYESAAIIIGHTHPSGSIEPSSSDRAVTTKIKTALSSIDVELLDHLILGNGNDGFYSFTNHDLM